MILASAPFLALGGVVELRARIRVFGDGDGFGIAAHQLGERISGGCPGFWRNGRNGCPARALAV
jgi:hypothetical protein